ncbi:Ig-like domain-containing protein [Mycolicibacterium sp. 050158]|uniref:Ig-like domain-containing protein n=1 Tax=Mycolicibacterium sp. 050158 TaxID=3090602 RepID=UPI00299F2926|nr:Ig-like domain-containing protein [Mycolicibacterium sp. 050158]MDX1890149.1 Ig-like domain-containing protein [Mycolicibacterium sp. 050158]
MRRELTHTFFNQSPTASPVQNVGQSLTGVVTGQLNASDPNGDPLSATVTRQGAYGTVTLASDGTYTYTPNAAVPAAGITDTFQVAIDDSGLHVGGLLGLVQGFFEHIARCIGIAQPDTIVKTVQVAVVGTLLPGSVPSVIATSGVLLYTAGDGPKTLDPLVTVVDTDSTTATKATVKISVGYDALTDSLVYSPASGGPITGSFDAATGVLTLTGTATMAQYQNALRAVTFASTADDLVGTRAVSIVVTADQVDSVPGLVTVVVSGLPGNVPSVVATTPVKLYTSGGVPVVLDANVTVVDVDSTSATKATVSFDSSTYDPTKDVLAYNGSGAITGVFDSATGVLTLSGAASLAQYQEALRSVTFASTAAVGLKTVSIAVTADGVAGIPGLIAITVAALPVLASVPAVIGTTPVKLYTSGGVPVVLDANVTVVDVDSTSATKATVSFDSSTYDPTKDVLAYNGSGAITGVFDSATGVLTLSGAASLAQYQEALRSVTFASTAAVGLKTVSIVVTSDTVASLPGVIGVTVAALPVVTNAPGLVVTTPAKLYTSGGSPVVLDANVTVIDADSSSATGATISLNPLTYDATKDSLAYNGSGVITGMFDSTTGVLTLSGTASLADYQAALRSVTFASTATVGVKTVSVVVTSDGVSSVPGLIAVTVAALPVVTNGPGLVVTTPAKLYTGNGSSVVLDANVTLADADSSSATRATVSFDPLTFSSGTDSLGFTDTSAITGSFNSTTGVLTLTGNASLAQYQAALRSVTFASTATVGVKTVSVVVTSDGVTSVPGLIAVTVAALPVVTNGPGLVVTTPAKLYTGNGSSVVLDANVTLADADSTSATKATVSFDPLTYANGADVLGFTNTGGIAGAFDSATGVLTLTGAASLADYQAALRSVTFASTATVGVKTVSIVVTSDAVNSLPGAIAVTVAALPVSASAPGAVGTTPVKLYTGNGTPVVLDANVSLVDVDSTTATGATMSFDPLTYTSGADTLGFTNTGGITGSFDASTGVLTLTGNTSLSNYQAALGSVTFASTATVGLKTVSIVVTSDGVNSLPGAIAVTVASLPAAASAPGAVGTTPVKLYTGNGTPVVLDANVSLVDVDSTTATGATVSFDPLTYSAGADTLGFTNTGLITGSFNSSTGVLTLTGNTSLANYQAALRSVTFASTATAGVKTVSVVVTSDGVNSLPGLIAVTVAALPVVTNGPGLVVTTPAKLYTGNGSSVVLDANVTLADADSSSATKATVSFDPLTFSSGTDSLGFTDTGSITGAFDSATGVLTLTGAASLADYQAALRSVTFASTATAGVKTVSIVVTSDAVNSVPGAIAVTVAALPVVTNGPGLVVTTPAKLYTGNGSSVVLDANVTLADADSTSATKATVSFDPLTYSSGTDSLGFTDTSAITGSFNSTTGVLTLTGAASLADYQAALRSVTFASTATAGVKTVSIVVTSDAVNSVPGAIAVTVVGLPVVSNTPGLVVTTPAKLYTGNGTPVALDANVSLVDVDSTTATGATVSFDPLTYTSGADTLGFTNTGGITGSFDASTGVLTLTGNTSLSNYQAALRSVTFASTATVGLKTVSVVVTSDGVSSVPGLIAVTVAALPVVTNGPGLVVTTPAKLYTGNGSSVVLDANVTLADADSTSATKATVSFDPLTYSSGTDSLGFTDTSGIAGAFDSATGVLTLTGAASLADYQAALRSVTFASTATAGVKTVSIVVTSDAVNSVPGAIAVTVAALPVVTNGPGLVVTTPAKLYTGNGSSVVLDANVTLADADSSSATKATVSFDPLTFSSGTDSLGFTDTSAITGSFNSTTGVLTLTGAASLADYQAALRSVTFASTATAGVKTVSIVVTSDAVNSVPGAIAVTVVGLPVVSNTPGLVVTTPAKLYTGSGSSVVLDANVTLADADSSSATKATVSFDPLTFSSGTDSLGFTDTSAITGSFDPTTGVLTLTGAASLADYQAALRSVTFASTAAPGLKTLSIVVTSDAVNSLPGAIAVTVASLPAAASAPGAVGTSPVKLYTGNGTPVVLDANVSLVDVDSTTATGATVSFDPLTYSSGTDSLGFTDTGSITGSFNSTTGVLTLSGNASLADYQAALRSVTFASTAAPGLKTVSIVVTSDAVNSLPGAIAVTVASLPVSASAPGAVGTTPVKLYTGNGTPVVLDANVSLVDVDSTTASGATVSFDPLTYSAGADTLGFTNTGGITGSFDVITGVLTLTGSTSLSNYQAALRSVTFASTAAPGLKTVSIVVTSDGVNSLPGAIAVTVASLPATASAPGAVGTTPVKLYTGNGTPVVLDANVSLVDVDSTTASGATVSFDPLTYSAGADTLGFTNTGLITGTFNSSTGVLTLTGSTSLSNYQAALRSVTFASTATAGVKTVSIVVTSDGVNSLPGAIAVTVASLPAATNVPPLVTTSGVRSYTAGSSAIAVDPALSVVDIDSPNLTGATVSIGGGFVSSTDTLAYTQGASPISGTYDAAAGVLTLTGTGTVAQYQAALQSVTFSTTPAALAAIKTVSVVVTDGTAPSIPATVAVTVTALPVNVPPLVTTSLANLSYTAGSAATTLDSGITVTDVDSATISGAKVSVTTGFATGDTLAFANANGITGNYDSGTGVLTLSGSATVAQYQQALRSVTFSTASSALAAIKTVSIVVTDANGTQSISAPLAVTVLAAPVNVPPLVVTSLVSAVSYTAGSAPVKLDQLLLVTDVDSTFLSGAQVSITGGFATGDALAFTQGNGITGNYNASTGVLALSGTATVANYQQALRSVTFATGSSAAAALKTVSIVVTDFQGASSVSLPLTVAVLALPVNVAPVVVSSLINTVPYTVGNAPAVLDGAVTILEDSTTISGATVTIGLGRQTGDALSFTQPGGSSITGTYNSTTGVLTLSGTGTVDQYETALRSVTFATPTAGLLGVRTVSMVVTDGLGASSVSVPLTVTVGANTAPVVSSTLLTSLVYTSGSGAKVLDAGLAVVDNSTFMSGATVTITLGKASGDSITFTPGNGITGTYNSTTGVLTLTGSATAAQYQAVLRTVSFATSSSTLVSAARTFSVAVTDQQGLTGSVLILMTVIGL